MRQGIWVGWVVFAAFLLQGCSWLPVGVPQTDIRPSFNRLVEQVKPALVQIKSVNPEGAFLIALSEKLNTPIPEDFRHLVKMSSGSGFLVDPSGIVVTNNHVLQPGWFTTVELADGRKFLVEGQAGNARTDIGVIVLKGVREPLPFVAFALRSAQVGDTVFSVGRASYMDMSFKTGVVSHIKRSVSSVMTNVQTTMPVNPGDSGSAVFNTEGKIVGVVRAYYPGLNGVTVFVSKIDTEVSIEKLLRKIRDK